MPTATLKFDLLEEKHEFMDAIKGVSYSLVIWDMDQYLRSRLKYEDLSQEVSKELEAVRDKLYELCGDRNCSEVLTG